MKSCNVSERLQIMKKTMDPKSSAYRLKLDTMLEHCLELKDLLKVKRYEEVNFGNLSLKSNMDTIEFLHFRYESSIRALRNTWRTARMMHMSLNSIGLHLTFGHTFKLSGIRY